MRESKQIIQSFGFRVPVHPLLELVLGNHDAGADFQGRESFRPNQIISTGTGDSQCCRHLRDGEHQRQFIVRFELHLFHIASFYLPVGRLFLCYSSSCLYTSSPSGEVELPQELWSETTHPEIESVVTLVLFHFILIGHGILYLLNFLSAPE